MNKEKSLLINIFAIVFLIILGFSIYKVAVSKDTGINLLDKNKVENRVAYRYVNKNVLNDKSTYVFGGQAEDSAANIVTSIVADYRLFDTTLEVIVLFISIMGFSMVLPKEKHFIKPSSSIIKYWSPILMIFMVMAGFYMFINGHLSPGGGFPAGAILSTAVLIGFLSKTKVPSQKAFKYIEAISGTLIFTMGIIAYMINGSFFYNFLEGGRIGNILSGGIIPIFYSLVAFKVSAELSSVFYDFYQEEEDYELD